MPAGRPRKPTAIKVLEGNRGHRNLDEAESTQETAIPQKPAGMSDNASMIWDELVDQLKNVRGLLQVIDQRALWQLSEDEVILAEMYAGIHMAACAIENKARAEGKQLVGTPLFQFASTTAGRMIMSTLNNWSGRVITERREFGLMPASRVRLNIGKIGGTEMDELEKQMGGWSPAAEEAG